MPIRHNYTAKPPTAERIAAPPGPPPLVPPPFPPAPIGGTDTIVSGYELRPRNFATILPSQPIEIAFDFLIDESSLSSIIVTDAIFDREVQADAAIEYYKAGGKSVVAIKPDPEKPWVWGHRHDFTLSGLKKWDRTLAIPNGLQASYFVQNRPAPSAFVTAEQMALLVGRKGGGIWKTGSSEQVTWIINHDKYKENPLKAYPVRPATYEQIVEMYDGLYNKTGKQGRGGGADSQLLLARAWQWRLTGNATHLAEAKKVLLEWVYKFPVGRPDSNVQWDYAQRYNIMFHCLLFGFELIRDQLTLGEVNDTIEHLRTYAYDPIQFAHERTSDTKPNNIRTWDNASFLGAAAVTGDWYLREHVYGRTALKQPFPFPGQWALAVDKVNGVPRMHDRNREEPTHPYNGITYSVYHLEAWTWAAHHRFMMDGQTDLWHIPDDAAEAWTIAEVIEEYQRAVRCEAGSGFENKEGYCVNFAGDDDPVNDRLRRRLIDAWKLSAMANLAHPDLSLYELILSANRGGFSQYATADSHIPGFGAPFKGYPAAGWPLGGKQKPPAPSNFRVVDTGRTWVRVACDQPTPVNEYGAPVRWIWTVNGGERVRSIVSEAVVSRDMEPGRTYTLRVRAVNEAAEEQASGSPLTVTTLAV